MRVGGMPDEGARREGGYAALWVIIILALLGLGLLIAASFDPDAEIPGLWVAACGFVVASGLAFEARHDLYEFCKITGFLCFVTAFVCGLVLMVSDPMSPALVATTVALAVASAGAFMAQYRLGNAEEMLPNALAELFDNKALVELSGVQFGVTHSDLQVPAGGELLVSVHAQNGMDADRRFELRLKPRADIGKGGHLSFDKLVSLDLPPGAAGRITVPVAVHPKARGTYQINVEPRVKGSGGTRLRVYRARAFSQKVSGGMQILALFAGIFIWGGGLNLKLKVAKNKNWKSMPVEEHSPGEAELFYEPDRALLEAIRLRF